MTAIAWQHTIEDLYKVEGKAELVGGRIVHMSPTGYRPNRAAGLIFRSLAAHVGDAADALLVTDGCAFTVDLPNRKSFSPDVGLQFGQPPGMKFIDGAPDFAVEVRSAGDYGPAAEREMAAKRRDYVAAGTRVVWDVDVRDEPVVRKYTPDTIDQPEVFTAGDSADAEPAVAGWRFDVAGLRG